VNKKFLTTKGMAGVYRLRLLLIGRMREVRRRRTAPAAIQRGPGFSSSASRIWDEFHRTLQSRGGGRVEIARGCPGYIDKVWHSPERQQVTAGGDLCS